MASHAAALAGTEAQCADVCLWGSCTPSCWSLPKIHLPLAARFCHQLCDAWYCADRRLPCSCTALVASHICTLDRGQAQMLQELQGARKEGVCCLVGAT